MEGNKLLREYNPFGTGRRACENLTPSACILVYPGECGWRRDGRHDVGLRDLVAVVQIEMVEKTENKQRIEEQLAGRRTI